MPFIFALCADMLWRDRLIEWRGTRPNEMGLQGGLRNWPAHDLGKLTASGATFSILNGGRLTDDEGADELLKTTRETSRVGKLRRVARLNLHGTGLGKGAAAVQPIQGATGAM